MKRLSGEQIFALMSDIDPHLLAEAVPPSWVGDGGRGTVKEKKHPFAWLDSGWAAAILSTVVAVAVLVAVVLAGRMGSGDPPAGSLPETDRESTAPEDTTPPDHTTPPEDTASYALEYIPNGNGTCTVAILMDDRNTVWHNVVIPEKSPMGDTVTAVENRFNAHTLLPRVMTVEGFETYVKAPMEAYFGVSVEEAESMKPDAEDPLYVAGFELRKYLAYFLYRPQDMLFSLDAEAPALGLIFIDTDIYLLELTVSDEEIRSLSALLALVGFNADSWEAINRDLVSHGAPADTYPEDIVLSAGIQTLTLPATLRELPDGMLDSWMNLETVVFEGTVEQWNTMTKGVWNAVVPVQCTDGRIPAEGETDQTPDLTVNTTTIRMETPGDHAAYLKGYIHWTDVYTDGGMASADMVYPTLEELYNEGLPCLTLREGGVPTVTHEQTEGYTYRLTADVYAPNDLGGDRLYRLEASNGQAFDSFATLPVGVYVVELSVTASGGMTDELGNREGYGAVFAFTLLVTKQSTEEPTLDSTTMSVEAHDGRKVYIPGMLASHTFLYQDGDNPPELMTVNAAIESIEDIVENELVAVTCSARNFDFETTEGWTYERSIKVYDTELDMVMAGGTYALGSVGYGIFYVEVTVQGTGPYIPELGGHEAYTTIFTYRLNLIYDGGSADNGTGVPIAASYVGELGADFKAIYDRYPSWSIRTFRWRVERRTGAGEFIEEIPVDGEIFTLSEYGADIPAIPFDAATDPDYIYYFHYTVLEDGEWKSVGYIAIEVAVDE